MKIRLRKKGLAKDSGNFHTSLKGEAGYDNSRLVPAHNAAKGFPLYQTKALTKPT